VTKVVQVERNIKKVYFFLLPKRRLKKKKKGNDLH
jgi:hypothetical protein